MTIMKQYPGSLISLEGIDGSGKSSLAKKIASALVSQGLMVLLTKEPGGTELGKSLRQILHTQKAHVCDKAEYLLFAADRAQHFEEVIIPALNDGTIVISDRLADSSLAYQGYGRGLDKAMITSINRWAMSGITPDATIYLEIDPITAFERIAKRNEVLTSFEQERLDFWQRVLQGYEEIFAQRANVIKLDGKQSLETSRHQAVNALLKLII